MVHGGLRYLASGKVGVAWESAVERACIAQHIAPHLVHPFAQVVPIWADTPMSQRLATRAGLSAGDMLRRASRLPRSRLPAPAKVNVERAKQLIPTINPDALLGAYVSWDFRLEDDARLVVSIARTAAAYGATVLTGARASNVNPEGATITDTVDGGIFSIRARHVINATGVWAGTLDPEIHVAPSRGTHLVIPAQLLGRPRASMAMAVPDHFGRFVFTIPQFDDVVFAGLTDVPANGPIPDVPTASEEEIAWILAILNRGLSRPIERSDILGTFAGLRPLVADPEHAGESADISRHHLVTGGPGEVITVTGGKLTTYRRMAQDAVDRVTQTPCVTRQIALVGAGNAAISTSVPTRLIRRFGSEAPAVAALAATNSRLLDPVDDGIHSDVLGVEIAWARIAEGATSVDDVLERRTRIGLVPEDAQRVRPKVTALFDAAGV
jgi:glycerol-3-phosphate dehydrogenase